MDPNVYDDYNLIARDPHGYYLQTTVIYVYAPTR